jgi:hypothetical protein
MALKLKVENKDFPKGHEFSVEGLGVFENGKEREVFAEQEAAFEDATGNTLKEAFDKNEMFKLSGDKANPAPVEEEEAPAKEEGDNE